MNKLNDNTNIKINHVDIHNESSQNMIKDMKKILLNEN